jgi:hypothetical protein
MPPRKVYPPAAPERLQALRPGRAATPGAVDKPKPKRSSAEVAADKRRNEESKKKKLADREAAILAVSEKENRMAEADRAADDVADHPPANTARKAPRTKFEANGEYRFEHQTVLMIRTMQM